MVTPDLGEAAANEMDGVHPLSGDEAQLTGVSRFRDRAAAVLKETKRIA